MIHWFSRRMFRLQNICRQAWAAVSAGICQPTCPLLESSQELYTELVLASPPTCDFAEARLAHAHEGVAGVHLLRHQRLGGRHEHHLALRQQSGQMCRVE